MVINTRGIIKMTDRIIELNVCAACKHSYQICDSRGNLIENICKIESKAVNPKGGLTDCYNWISR